MNRKKVVVIILSTVMILFLCAVCYFRFVSNDIKATELTHTNFKPPYRQIEQNMIY